MKLHWWPLLLFAAIGLILLAIAIQSVESNDGPIGGHAELKHHESNVVSARQKFKLPKIFDFEEYKKLFKRTYLGLEELVRRKLMLARALRVWISALKYKYMKSSFYLAINHFSDKTPEELSRMQNHELDDGPSMEAHGELAGVAQAPKGSIAEPEPNDIEEKLSKLANGDANSGGELKMLQEELKKESDERRRRRRRKKRDLGKKVRNFVMNKLISTGGDTKFDSKTANKLDGHPKSNNPAYRAPGGGGGGGFRTNFDQLRWWQTKLQEKKTTVKEEPQSGSFPVEVSESLNATGSKDDDNLQVVVEAGDEVFFDHRESNCMFPPRYQGVCGSCYAFVAVAIAEWLYCKQTGKLVAFSEQYLIDCGSPQLFKGCMGGTKWEAPTFIHNYGLELQSNYPYRGIQDKCPYDHHTDPKSMGYIRMDLGSGVGVPVEHLEPAIKFAPMHLSIYAPYAFYDYGGGVMGGSGCYMRDAHAVVLIGHGREDGQEYWLIRNSFGEAWGEGGHFKMSKNLDCIIDRMAVMYGSKDATNFTFQSEVNQINNQSAVEAHYARRKEVARQPLRW